MSNHVSWADSFAMIGAFSGDICFASNADVRKMPGIGYIAEKLGCIFINRSSDKASLNGVLDTMHKRTELIETKGIFPPIWIYPEGMTSNGKALTKFRRGAFSDLR